MDERGWGQDVWQARGTSRVCCVPALCLHVTSPVRLMLLVVTVATCCYHQVLEAIAKGRLDFANTLSARGFLPGWYTQHLAALQHKGMSAATATASAAAAASGGGIGGDVYGPEAVCPGGPDEYSHNSRIIKAAIAAGGCAVCGCGCGCGGGGGENRGGREGMCSAFGGGWSHVQARCMIDARVTSEL